MIDMVRANSEVVYNISLAFEAGLQVPEIKYLRNMNDEEIEEIILDREWMVVLDENVALRDIRGIRVTLVQFYDGNDFIFPHIIINDRSLLTGGQGPILPANAVTAFKNLGGLGDNQFGKIRRMFKAKFLDFQGFITLDCVFDEDRVWYYHIGFGLLDDYLIALSALYGVEISEDNLPEETEYNFACSLRLWGYPYSESNTAMVEGLPVDMFNVLNLAKGEECYHLISTGRRIFEAWRNLYLSIPDGLHEYGVCYRNDGDVLAKQTYYMMKKRRLLWQRESPSTELSQSSFSVEESPSDTSSSDAEMATG